MKTTILKLSLTLIASISVGCSNSASPSHTESKSDLYVKCTEPTPVDDSSKEDMLIIGDSISIGYTPTVRAAFPEYEVLHNPCNGMTSVNGLAHVDEWLAMRNHWKVITFNHGLWDIVPFYNVSIEAYRAALIEEGTKIKAVADHVIFFTSTYVPPGSDNRDNENILIYNQVAVETMRGLGISVIDLYRVSRSLDDQHATDNFVHYNDYGYSVLGKSVINAINLSMSGGI